MLRIMEEDGGLLSIMGEGGEGKGYANYAGIVLGIIGLTVMPEQCWHNKDIFLPKLAIVINCCPIIYKYIDHKAIIILCIWIENTTLFKKRKSHYLSSKFYSKWA